MDSQNIMNYLRNLYFADTIDDKQTLTEAEFNKLDTLTISDTNMTCPITQIDFFPGETVKKLPCNHCFEPDAIKKWLMEHKAECPVCRYKFAIRTKPTNTFANEPDLYMLFSGDYTNILNNLNAQDSLIETSIMFSYILTHT